MVKKYVSDYGHSGEVEWKEADDSYEVDNSELLAQRADVEKDESTGEFKLTGEGLGSIEHGEETQKLRADLKRTGWVEPSTVKRKGEIRHVCPICGTKFVGRANKKFCSDRCKNTSHKRTQRGNDIRKFKPHRGKAGEIYFKIRDSDGVERATFVPAAYCDNMDNALNWLDKNYENHPLLENFKKQVKVAINRK